MHSHFRQCCSRLQERYPRESWLVSLGLSATTDYSDVSGWRGDAIMQDRLFYRSISTAISMFREQMQLSGRSSRYLLSRLLTSYISSMLLAWVSWSSIQQWYSHPPLRAGRSYSWPQKGRKLYDRDLDHRPWPRSVSFAGLRYRAADNISVGWDVSCLQPRYGIEFMGYQVSWWSSRLWGNHIIQFSFNVWLNNWLDYLVVLKWP